MSHKGHTSWHAVYTCWLFFSPHNCLHRQPLTHFLFHSPALHPLLLSHAHWISLSSLSLELIPQTVFPPLIIHSHLHLLDTPYPSSWFRLVSQDALFGAASLGPSSMGGDWVGRRSTDWTLSLRTGALAGHPPSTSDGRGRWEPQNQPHLLTRLRHWR